MCKKLLWLNPVAMESAGKKPKGSFKVCPNYLSHIEKWGSHYTLFVAMLHLLHSVTDKITVQETSLQMNPHCYRKSQWETISRYRKLTPCIVSEKN